MATLAPSGGVGPYTCCVEGSSSRPHQLSCFKNLLMKQYFTNNSVIVRKKERDNCPKCADDVSSVSRT